MVPATFPVSSVPTPTINSHCRLGTAVAGRRRPGGVADCAEAAPGAGLAAAESAGLIGARGHPHLSMGSSHLLNKGLPLVRL